MIVMTPTNFGQLGPPLLPHFYGDVPAPRIVCYFIHVYCLYEVGIFSDYQLVSVCAFEFVFRVCQVLALLTAISNRVPYFYVYWLCVTCCPSCGWFFVRNGCLQQIRAADESTSGPDKE